MTKHGDKELHLFKWRYLISPFVTKLAVMCVHLQFESNMAWRSCFSDSFARKVWEELHVYTILRLRFQVRFSYAVDFRTGKCSAVAPCDKIPTLWFMCPVCETERENTDRTLWNTRSGRGYGLFVQQTGWCVSDIMFLLISVARIMNGS
jgi:hypothetical protein